MNTLAESFETLGTNGYGLRHLQLPRGTSHPVYLPMLCQSMRKNLHLMQSAEGRMDATRDGGGILSVLPDRNTVQYVKRSRHDVYCNEITLMNTGTLLAHLRDDDLFLKLCCKCRWWFVDCHDLLSGDVSDEVCKCVISRFACRDAELHARRVYCLIVHSASTADVLREYPKLSGRSVRCVIAPQENKFNILVSSLSSVGECISYVTKSVEHRLLGRSFDHNFRSFSGDTLVISRTVEDALLTQSLLKSSLACSSDRVCVKMVGPMQIGILHDIQKLRFNPGIVYSQSLESYSSYDSNQYGLMRVDHNPLGGSVHPQVDSRSTRNERETKNIYSSASINNTSVSTSYPNSTQVSNLATSCSHGDRDRHRDRDRDSFTVYVSWGDWCYYSTKLWKVSSIFVFYVDLPGTPLSHAERERIYLTASAGAVGLRNTMLTISHLGMSSEREKHSH